MRPSPLDRAGPEVLVLLDRLEAALGRRLLRRGDRLRTAVMQDWIAYRGVSSGLTFAELRPRKRHVEVFLLPSPSELGPHAGPLVPVPRTRGWGWFRGRLIVRPGDDLAEPLGLLEASHALCARRPRHRPRGRWMRSRGRRESGGRRFRGSPRAPEDAPSIPRRPAHPRGEPGGR